MRRSNRDITIGSPDHQLIDQPPTGIRRQEFVGDGFDPIRRGHPATVGVFQFFQGLAAIIKGNFYVVAPNNIYEFSTGGRGWIHLILGIELAVTGFFNLTCQTWARVIGIAVAALSALSNFLFIPYYSLWALVLIALDVAVIWALTTYRPQD